MAIAPLMTLLPNELQDKINAIIAHKATVLESHAIKIDDEILRFIEQTMQDIADKVQLLPERRFKTGPLNDFFLQTLNQLN